MKTSFYFILLSVVLIMSCGKSDLELEKEKIRKEAAELKMKIDSTQTKIDSGWKELDSLNYKIQRTSKELDSLEKRMNPLK